MRPAAGGLTAQPDARVTTEAPDRARGREALAHTRIGRMRRAGYAADADAGYDCQAGPAAVREAAQTPWARINLS